MTADITAETKPIQDKPFIVFHDAYQYFEKRFGLTAVGSISDVSAAAPSARRLNEIRRRLEGPAGRSRSHRQRITPGPRAYAELLNQLAKDARDCLMN